ncbi:MAG: hypothetical protein ABW001_05365 [Mycobacterium sp.]
MGMDTTPPDEIGAREEVGDAQISEIVEQELATAVADPEAVFVLHVQFQGDSYTSVHTSRDGADARLLETASQWGITDLLDNDQLVHQITKLPVETP